MEKKKIMISQPMRGKTNEQIKEERKTIVRELENEGYEVLDTVFEKAPANVDEAVWFLSESINFLAQADIVLFMRGWEKSRGCKIEHQVAVEYGKEVYYEN